MATAPVSVNLESLKGEKLGSGCYGSVYALKNDPTRVIKIAQNDGTRTYLEWCKARQSAGKGMRGMPRIDALWSVSGWHGQYACIMERLPIDPGKHLGQEGWTKYFGHPVYSPASEVDYLKVLVEAMRTETGVQGCDMHYQNFLMRKDGTIVLTDPDSGSHDMPKPSPLTKNEEFVGPMLQQDLFAGWQLNPWTGEWLVS